MLFLGAVGSLSLLQPPPTRSQGNQILINSNSSSSSNVYPMDCEPSLNMNQQRYLQHMHRSNRFNVPPLSLGSSYISQSQQKYAPASLPLDLITVATAAANNGNGSSSIMVLPSTATQDHLNKVGTGSSRNNNNSNSNNNNADEMVIQQSPVVIH